VTRRFNKDKWILHAIKYRYLVPKEDGSILRCRRATNKGELVSDQYDPIKVRVHKKSGRVYFNMTWMGFTKSVLVNRAVALRFLPNPSNLPQVNHIDGDKENNALTNLEWSSGSDNERHAHRNGLKTGRGSQNSNAKLTADQVIEIRKLAETKSVPDLMDQFGIARSTLSNIIKRTTWKHV